MEISESAGVAGEETIAAATAGAKEDINLSKRSMNLRLTKRRKTFFYHGLRPLYARSWG